MELKLIKQVAEKGDYDRALTECEKLLRKGGSKNADILRTRAYVFALSGDYDRAVKDRRTVLGMVDATIDDYFLAANNAISAGKMKQASVWLNEVLRLGNEQKETWFEVASLFLLAYSQMELRQYTKALASLSRATELQPGCAMPLPRIGMYNHEQLRDEIRKRVNRTTNRKRKRRNQDRS